MREEHGALAERESQRNDQVRLAGKIGYDMK